VLTPIATSSDIVALQEALLHRLELLSKLTRYAGAGLAYAAPDAPASWLVSVPGCPCEGEFVPTDACPADMMQKSVEVTCDGAPAGSVILCVPRCSPGLLESLTAMVGTAVRCAELECGEEALLSELSAAWESLEAVSEVSAGMRSLEDTSALLERIMSRAVGNRAGLQAVLWLQRDGRLEPAVTRCRVPCEARATSGLVGRALAEHSGIILNDAARIAAVPDLEPELFGARSVAIAPVTTRQGLLGALVIWHEDENCGFDSRTMLLASTLALQAAMVAENDRLHRASLDNERLRQEVEIGSVIQQTLLLGLPPGGMRSFRLATLAVPSALVDGDFYDFFRHDDGTLDVAIGDVMGKGVPAALVGAATKSQLLRALSGLLGTGVRLPGVVDVISAAHQVVVPQLIALERFVTLCYARFESPQRRLTLVDCGHTRTVHYRSRDRSVALLQGFDTPLGFCEESSYRPFVVSFEAGDVFFFYSDGLTETRGRSGEAFGEKRLAELVAQHGDLAPAALVELLRQAVVGFSATGTFADDLTCVAVQITPPLQRVTRQFDCELTSLGAVRDLVGEACARIPEYRLHPEALGCFTLAVNEAASNVVRHSCDEDAKRTFYIDCDVYDDRVEVLLRHRGELFAPSPGQEAAPTAPREGGLGLFIIRQFASEVEYNVDAAGYTYTRLVKRFIPQ
jgi:sigma-B regulation protein RsbU (phosphoserine phosphatase)